VVVTVGVTLEKEEDTTKRQLKLDPKPVVIGQSSTTENEMVREKRRNAEPGGNPNVPVQVQNRPDANAGREREMSLEESQKQLITGGEESVGKVQGLRVLTSTATVTVPESFYREQLQQQGVTAPAAEAPATEHQQYREKILAEEAKHKPKIMAAVAAHLRAPEGVDPTTFAKVISAPWTPPSVIEGPGMMDMAGDVVHSYGRSIGLGLFALAALFMLNRSMKGVPATPEPDLEAILNPPQPPQPEEKVREPEPLPPSRRDDVQFLVQDNPEMAAAVLNKWLSH